MIILFIIKNNKFNKSDFLFRFLLRYTCTVTSSSTITSIRVFVENYKIYKLYKKISSFMHQFVDLITKELRRGEKMENCKDVHNIYHVSLDSRLEYPSSMADLCPSFSTGIF